MVKGQLQNSTTKIQIDASDFEASSKGIKRQRKRSDTIYIKTSFQINQLDFKQAAPELVF